MMDSGKVNLGSGIDVGIIGGGVMGIGIAQLALLHSHGVILIEAGGDTDHRKAVNEKIIATLTGYLDKMVIKNKLTSENKRDCLSRLEIHFDLKELKRLKKVSLVIEAVTEDLNLKQSLLQEVERWVGKEVLITSNTSTFSITALSSCLQDPPRLVGLHFFNPPPLMKLVEVVKGLNTRPDVVEGVRLWAERWGKTVVVSNSSPGFIVNRIARPYYCEALSLLDGGADPTTIDALLVGSGIFPIGVFALIDLIGMDTNYRNTEEMFKAFHYNTRFKPSHTQWEYVLAGRLGRKNGRGFYEYRENKPVANPGFFPSKPKTPIAEKTFLKNLQVEIRGQDPTLLEITKGLKKHRVSVRVGRGRDQLIIKYGAPQPLKIGVVMSDGGLNLPSATSRLSLLKPLYPLVMLDLVIDFDRMTAVAVSEGLNKSITQKEKDILSQVFGLLGKEVVFIPPTPGMVIQRILMVIIDEALQAVGEGVCREEEVDTALALGMNFRRQPCELLNALTPGYVHLVLENLYETTGLEKYRPSLTLLRKVLEKRKKGYNKRYRL